ncbi:MAG: ArsC/Spx/MgsR family protein [Marinibacterium sp.]
MTIYGLKTCDTCRKARKILGDAGFVDVREDGLPESVMEDALAKFGDDLLNRRSTTWRGLDADQRARPARELLRAYPTLMKRPLILSDGQLYLGWGKEVQAALAG